MRLIDADALIEAMGEEPSIWNHKADEIAGLIQWQLDMSIIEEQPTIEPCEDAISRADLIKRLEKDPIGKTWIKYNNLDGFINAIPSVAPTINSCEDAISREWLLKFFEEDEGKDRHTPIDSLIALIKDAPSVAPSRPSGEWLEAVYEGQPYNVYGVMYKCSECGYVPMYMGEPIIPTTATLLFCPNCGAKMRESE